MAANARRTRRRCARSTSRIETLVTPVAAQRRGRQAQGRHLPAQHPRQDAATAASRQITPVAGSEFEMPCDTLIFAIGQTQDAGNPAGGRATRRADIAPACAELFVAGDFASGNARRDQRRGRRQGGRRRDRRVPDGPARAADTCVAGRSRRTITGRLRDHDLVDPPRDARAAACRARPRRRSGTRLRPRGGATPTPGAATCATTSSRSTRTSASTATGASRSRRGLHPAAEPSWRRDADGSRRRLHRSARQRTRRKATYIWIDSDQCIRCGNCINICPADAISLRKADIAPASWSRG